MSRRKKFATQYNPLKTWETAWKNNVSYMHYYQYLKNIAVNMYKWENLPATIDERYLEIMLFERGFVLFFKDEYIGYLALNTTVGGTLDVYNIPMNYMAYASNGYNNMQNIDSSVLIFDNYLHTTKHLDVDMFAQKLYNIDRTIDINVDAQKTPVLITCPEDQKLTMKNAYMSYKGNEPVIYGYSEFDSEAIKVFKTDAPYLVSNLLTDKNKIWNEAMTFLGVNNSNTEKKERMISDEANSNNEQVGMSRQIGLNARLQACDRINRMFGLNVSVRYNDGETLRQVREYAEAKNVSDPEPEDEGEVLPDE